MKRLLAALLPSESREHVLGDLAQRGYRAGDILSVLPRIWWRTCFGPIPRLAGAGEEALLNRAAQLRRSAHWGVSTFMWFSLITCSETFLGIRGPWPILSGFILALIFHLYWQRRARIQLSPTPLDAYRHAVSLRFDIALWPVWLWMLAAMTIPKSLGVHLDKPLVLTVAIVTWILAGYRFSRLKREGEAVS